MIVADKDISLQVSGNGDVLEPHDGILGRLACSLAQANAHAPYRLACTGIPIMPDNAACCIIPIAIGSGGNFALAAARALIDIPGMDAEAIGAAR